MLSGGSFSSVSVTPAANTVTVHVSLRPKSLAGSSVYVDGPPVAVAGRAPVAEQEMENQDPAVATSSLNVIVMFESRATSEAFAAGGCELTRGAWSGSQKCEV